MYDFISYVLDLLKRGIVLGFIAALAAAAILTCFFLVYRRKYPQRKLPIGKAVLWASFCGYLAIVIFATFLRGAVPRDINLHLFRAWREAWNNFSAKNWANVLLNVAMFIPFGAFLPLLIKPLRKWYAPILAGGLFSLFIELLQLALGTGICDVDDLFANTLGAWVGGFLALSAIAIFDRHAPHRKRGLLLGALGLLPIASIGGIFLAYSLQTYGNLPDDAAYYIDLRNLDWQSVCSLPETDGTAAVYCAQPRTLAQADSFAEDFAQFDGAKFDDIIYYQEAAYYLDHGSENGYFFLFLHYNDDGYEYNRGTPSDMSNITVDRETAESALSHYGIRISEDAAFSVGEYHWHSFTVSQAIDGAQMLDGTLRCRFYEDGSVSDIENDLLTYRFFRREPIISAEEALALLQRGHFSSAESLPSCGEQSVQLRNCTLSYEVDTKGFYQPVYRFELFLPESGYTFDAMIPALS